MATLLVALRWDGQKLSRQQLLDRAHNACAAVDAAFQQVDHLDVQAIPDENGQYVQLVVKTDATASDCDKMKTLFKARFEGDASSPAAARNSEPGTQSFSNSASASPPQPSASNTDSKTRTLDEALNDLPFSLIGISEPGLEEKLHQLLGALAGASDREVKQEEFDVLTRTCGSWGFQTVLHGDQAAVEATLSKRLRETGATRVGWTRSRPFGDVAMEKVQQAGLTGRCLFLLADSSGGPVFAFAVGPRVLASAGKVSKLWLAGNGLTTLLSGGAPNQTTTSQPDKQRTQDIAPAHGAPRAQQEAARSERVGQPQKGTTTEAPAEETPKDETVGGALKFLGFAVIMQPVAFGLAFLAFNMAKYNYQRLPNPIAFVMMVATGFFAAVFAIAGPGLLISSIVSCVKVAMNAGAKNKKHHERKEQSK